MEVYDCEKYNSVENRMRLLNNETTVWYIFLFLVICNIFINNIQRENLTDKNNLCLKNKIHNGSMMIAVISLILYIYFFKLSYNNLIYITNCRDIAEKQDAILTIIANLLFIIAGVIAVYLESKGIVPIVPSV